MKAAKIINDNVVSARDEEGREAIVMERGVGPKTKKGNIVDKKKVEKIFRLENRDTMDKLKELLENPPMEYVQISAEIIDYVKEVLNRPINPNVYITLTSHINFILGRYKQRIIFSNPLIREVRSFHHAKYLVGEYAMAMIEGDLGVKLPVDGAAPIALHIINAEYDTPTSDTIKITNLIQQVLGVARKYFSIELDEQPSSYERFITHLHFLVQRVFVGEYMNLDNLEFQEITDRPYPEEYARSQKVQALIKLQYKRQVTKEGVVYLAPYTERIRTK